MSKQANYKAGKWQSEQNDKASTWQSKQLAKRAYRHRTRSWRTKKANNKNSNIYYQKFWHPQNLPLLALGLAPWCWHRVVSCSLRALWSWLWFRPHRELPCALPIVSRPLEGPHSGRSTYESKSIIKFEWNNRPISISFLSVEGHQSGWSTYESESINNWKESIGQNFPVVNLRFSSPRSGRWTRGKNLRNFPVG